MAKQATITIPSLADVDAEYKDLNERLAKLTERVGEIRSEIASVESAIRAEAQTAGPRLRSPIAELVGDADAAVVDRRRDLRELRQAEDNHSEAIAVIQRRIHDRRSVASRAVIVAVRNEIDKRVGGVVAAAEAALAAHADLESLLRDIEAEGVETDSLRGVIIPFFLTNGQAERYVAEHKGGVNG